MTLTMLQGGEKRGKSAGEEKRQIWGGGIEKEPVWAAGEETVSA